MEYLREDLRQLKPYKANEMGCTVKLDANESPFDLPDKVRMKLAGELLKGSALNRYPDSDSNELRCAIAGYCNVKSNEILVGTGSDELIQIIINAFADKGDTVLCPAPSFGMYKICSQIAGAIPVEIPLSADYEYDMTAYKHAAEKHHAKIVFICTPNNPTGNTIDKEQLLDFIKNYDGIVVIDEAYGEFCEYSFVQDAVRLPNAVVLKTFSKAMGLAGLRIGYSIADENLTSQIYMVKPPYNINSFSQKAALFVLDDLKSVRHRIQLIISERERLVSKLRSHSNITVYPSSANFVLVKVPDGETAVKILNKEGISIRDFSLSPYLENCLRITIGHRQENDLFYKVFKEAVEEMDKNV